MRFAHLSDLHLGKTVNNYSMLEDQRDILQKVLGIIDQEQADAVLIAGDVYDRPVPPLDAVNLLNDFLNALAERGLEVFLISGNHDSGDRLGFAADLLGRERIHIAGVWKGQPECTVLHDAHGPAAVWSIPFIRPSSINRFIAEEKDRVGTYTEAMRHAVSSAGIDSSIRNVLIAHQFVTGASLDPEGSEEFEIGGSDNIDASVFAPFDYTALGHIHRPQDISSPRIRYCGTPLKYSLGEIGQEKSVTIAELNEKGDLQVRAVPLTPLRGMSELRGSFLEVNAPAHIAAQAGDYVRVVLTDEQDIPDAAARLKVVYPYLMRLDYDNARTRNEQVLSVDAEAASRHPLELFEEFYEKQNGQPMSGELKRLAAEEIGKVFAKEQI